MQWNYAPGETKAAEGELRANCVKLALEVLLKDKPAFGFSGINNGSNASRYIGLALRPYGDFKLRKDKRTAGRRTTWRR